MPPEAKHGNEWSGDATGFATTHWSVVLAAQGTDSSAASTALENLFRAYQRPLYTYIRRQGKAHHDAQDLLQAFFYHLLAKEALRTVSRQRGRLRSFLLCSLKNFLTNDHDRVQATKRGGGHIVLSLEAIADEATFPEPAAPVQSPDQLFDQEWAQTIFSTALRRLEREFALDGKQAQFAALAPFLSTPPAPGDYERVAGEIGIRASLMATVVSRLRQRFRELVRAEIVATVATPAEVDAELSYLVELMAR